MPKGQEEQEKQPLPKKRGRQAKNRKENQEKKGVQGQQTKATPKRADRRRAKSKEEEVPVETMRRVTRSQSPLKKKAEEMGCEKAKAADADRRGKKKEEAGGKAVAMTKTVQSPPCSGRRQTRKQAMPKRIVRLPQGKEINAFFPVFLIFFFFFLEKVSFSVHT